GAGFGGAVVVQDEGPAEPVDAYVMVEGAEQQEVFEPGLAAAGAEDQMVHVASGGGLVTASRPGAVLIAEDDGAAQVGRDVLGLADVQGKALGGPGGAGQAGAQVGGEAAGAGHGVGGQGQQGAAQLRGLLAGQRGGRGAGAAAAGAAAWLAVPGQAVGAEQYLGHRVDGLPVHAAGDHRGDARVARRGLGGGAGQPARLAGAGGDPVPLGGGGARLAAQRG